jgi:hypothetical protein
MHRRAAIGKRYGQLVRHYRDRHGHDPSAGAVHELARQANLGTRQGKNRPARWLASAPPGVPNWTTTSAPVPPPAS